MQLSKKLRSADGLRGGQTLMFMCPGCGYAHAIGIGDGPGPRWSWNGNVERPSFSPSILEHSGHYVTSHKSGDPCWCSFYKENPPTPGERVFKCGVCHSFVRDGRIQFLADCTHALAGQTVDLPDFPTTENTP